MNILYAGPFTATRSFCVAILWTRGEKAVRLVLGGDPVFRRATIYDFIFVVYERDFYGVGI